jgi:putative phosphoribosyl transferase
MTESSRGQEPKKQVRVLSDIVQLEGSLRLPESAAALVVIVYGRMEGSEHTPGDLGDLDELAGVMWRAGLATLAVNLLTPENEELDKTTGFFRENAELLHQRVIDITNWLITDVETRNLPIGYFGSGVSGAAALAAAAVRPDAVDAIVTIAPRTDLVSSYLPRLVAPTLFIAAEKDEQAQDMSRKALSELTSDTTLDDVRAARERGLAHTFEAIPGAANAFENEQALHKVEELAIGWFTRYLSA